MKRKKPSIDVNAALERTAAESGVSMDEMLRDIEAAIDAAWEERTPETAEMWNKMGVNGRKPTPQEFIKFLSEQTMSEQ